jgi:cobalt transport protein
MAQNNTTLYIVCFAVVAIIVVGTLLLVPGEYGGSDDAGGEAAEDYGYKPWTDNWMANLGFELPGETESFLFAVQAAIGAIIIGYFIGVNSARKQLAAASDKQEA